MLRTLFAPNRLAVYLVALASLATALVPAFTDVGLEAAVPICVGVASFAGVVAKWLSGWQQYEQAVLQRDLIAYQAQARGEQLEKEARLAAEVGGRRNTPRVNLPR